MKKENNNFSFNSADLIEFAWSKKVILIVVTIGVAIFTALLSLRMTDMYKGTVALFPTSGTSISKALLSDNYSGRQTLYEFGEEEQAEQMLQILNSTQIKDRIVEKYNLVNHYGINPNNKYLKTEIDRKYNGNISFRRTKFRSIIIEVMDHDPVVAAAIANDIAMLVDTTINNMLRTRVMAALTAVEEEFNDITALVSVYQDSMNYFGRLGIISFDEQVKELYRGYTLALLNKDERAMNVIKAQINIFERHQGDFLRIHNSFYNYLALNHKFKAKYTEARLEAEQTLSHRYVVDYAKPADRKSYPKRSILVFQAMVAAFVFTFILLLIIEIRKKSRAVAV